MTIYLKVLGKKTAPWGEGAVASSIVRRGVKGRGKDRKPKLQNTVPVPGGKAPL